MDTRHKLYPGSGPCVTNNNPTPAYTGFISNRDYNRVHNGVSDESEAELPKLKVDDLDGMFRSDMLFSYSICF